MNRKFDTEARKRAVKLFLNEDLVVQALSLTSNLSGVVETLLVEYVEQQHPQRNAKAGELDATVSMWNEFSAKHGSFADEYSSL